MQNKQILDEQFFELYPPVLVFFPLEFYKDNPRLVRFKRERNYEGNIDTANEKVYIRHAGLWVSTKYMKIIDFSYNEMCLVLNTVSNTSIEKCDVVESLSGLKYDREYGGFYSKVRRWPGDDVHIISAEHYLRPLKMMNLSIIK